MTLLKLEQVGFGYHQTKPILSEINLSIDCGEKIALLGANGSGKSTLLKLFNGLLLPTQGRVTFEHRVTANPQERMTIRENIGYVFQNPESQIIGVTVFEEVAFGPGNLGLESSEISARVWAALELVGISELAEQPTNQLSGGQKQKLTIAAALAMRPRLLICDEVTAMLDVGAQREFRRLITELNQSHQLTVVLATHAMEEVAWADRVILLHAGSIVFDGLPADLFGGGLDLLAMGLERPALQRLIDLLNQYGTRVPKQIKSQEELVMWIVNQLKRS